MKVKVTSERLAPLTPLTKHAVIHIHEGAEVDVKVGVVAVVEEGVAYETLRNTSPDLLRVDSGTGEIWRIAPIDRELIGVVELRVRAWLKERSVEMTVTVVIVDVLDNELSINDVEMVVDRDEYATGSPLLKLTGIQADESAVFSFSLRGAADVYFEVRGDIVFVKRSVNYLPGSGVKGRVIVRNQINESAEAVIDIRFKNSFTAMTFDTGQLVIELAEDVAVYHIIHRYPPAGQGYSYSSVDYEPDVGVLENGVVYVKRGLDRETRDVYVLQVELSDNGNIARQQLVILVTDVNDNSPVIAHQTTWSVDSDAQPGSYVGTVVANDDDLHENSTLSYAIKDRRFSVHPRSGKVTVRERLYDIKGRLSVRVGVTDQSDTPLETIALVDVLVKPAGELTFQDGAYIELSVLEGRGHDYRIWDFVMTGYDGSDEVEFAVLGNNEEEEVPFTVVNGTLRAQYALDRETTPSYGFKVRAIRHSLTSFIDVFVTVADLNDNTPTWSDERLTYEIPENVEYGDVILTVNATDLDEGRNAALTYELEQASDTFELDPYTGELRLKLYLDYEGTRSYDLTLLSRDQGTPRLSISRKLRVEVTDVNDNVPVFAADTAREVEVREDVNIGDELTTFRATDADVGDVISYAVEWTRPLPPSGSEPFSIDARTGTLRVSATLDRERVSQYTLSIVARDSRDANATTASIKLTVEVLDVDDNVAVFSSRSTSLVGDSFAVLVKDLDRPEAQLEVTLDPEGDGRYFELLDGNVLASRQPDVTKRGPELKVELNAEGQRSTVTLFYPNPSEDRFRFEKAVYFAEIEEGRTNTPLLKVKVDLFPPKAGAVVRYYVISDGGHFEVNATSGVVSTSGLRLDVDHVTTGDHVTGGVTMRTVRILAVQDGDLTTVTTVSDSM